MKRRIWASMCALAVLAVLMTSALIFAVMNRQFLESMKAEVRNEASFLASIINSGGGSIRDGRSSEGNRITLVARDGTVVYDSAEDAPKMQNHADRPEVADAIRYGAGEAVRQSDTLSKQTFYAAQRLDDGSVIRAAVTTDDAFAAMMSCMPYLALILVVVSVATMLLASWQTGKLLKPINEMDLSRPLENDAYDELSPLLTRIDRQNRQISDDISELSARQEEFAAITKNMREGLIVLDAEGLVLFINVTACGLFGVESEQCYRKSVMNVSRNMSLRGSVNKALMGEGGESELETAGRIYQLAASPVTAEGTARGAVVLITDVTERRNAEQLRREFSANVSHELKTPLTSISGYAEIIKSGIVKKDDEPEFIKRIYDEAQRMISLVDDIIELSRLEEKSEVCITERVELLKIVRDVTSNLAERAQKVGVTINVCGTEAVIHGNARVAEEIVTNLCDNAIKYNVPGGNVTVSVTVAGDGAVLEVCDTGIGIAPEDQPRVFERFYRVDKSRSKGTGGTGLGLSIVKHAAMTLGGKISMDSALGKGTSIRINF